jgi:polar amino acid transport system substrate-binding protein
MNVILNAIEAVEKGGNIIIRGYYEEAKAVLQVEDNGRGMSEEEIHKMFEPFYSKKLNGVGLGLSVTYQLIQENNGEIRASSREGEGTVMTIWLPGCRKDENDVSCHGN